jgi:hypothetical protein
MSNKIFIPPSVLWRANGQAIDMIKPSAQQALKQEFESLKEEMIEEFLAHPVTQEIQGGASAPNISGTLSRGNLFSFIGFEAGSDPIQPVLEIFQSSSIDFYSRRRGEFIASIKIPSAQSIFAATPMPWAQGRSWAKGIESGISGLGFFISRMEAGRSEGGVQTKSKISAGRFKNTPYLSVLISEYTKKFSTIKGVKLIINK